MKFSEALIVVKSILTPSATEEVIASSSNEVPGNFASSKFLLKAS